MTEWSLHHEPFRHYKATNAAGKSTWNGANGQRIASVTQVLDGDKRLVNWAASRALAAGEHTARTFFTGVDAALDTSILSFGQLARTTGLLPDQIKDDAGEEGAAAHVYLASRLRGYEPGLAAGSTRTPYGIRQGIESFLTEHLVAPFIDAKGPRIERVVGDYDRAVAGTYDAQAYMRWDGYMRDQCPRLHRLDLKSSRSMQDKFFAQVSEYEREAVLSGEDPSDFLTIIHVDRAGNFKPYSIEVGSQEHKDAQSLFDAHLAIYRLGPKLTKLIR